MAKLHADQHVEVEYRMDELDLTAMGSKATYEEIKDYVLDHVWFDEHEIEGYGVGDCLSFFAEPYCYIKTGKGKQIDFGLRNPQGIKKIEKYELPSDEELMLQSIDTIICETCYLNEQCFGGMCIRDKKELQSLRKDMLKAVKESGKTTRNTNE